MKFAYLITSYNNFHVLKNLVQLLDDPRNDIFIHFDSKVQSIPTLETDKSKLTIINNRVDVRWGTYSQIQAYFELYREANKFGPYDFYHLVSGTTLPLKSQDYLHSFYNTYNGASMFRIWPKDVLESEFKLKRKHFWIDTFQSNNSLIKWFTQHFWTLNMFIQVKSGFRINKNEDFTKADCWASFSESAIRYLLENEKDIKRRYKHSFAGDEFYHISELKKDPAQKIVDNQHLLYVKFIEGEDHPTNLTRADYLELKESDYLFARKFSDTSL